VDVTYLVGDTEAREANLAFFCWDEPRENVLRGHFHLQLEQTFFHFQQSQISAAGRGIYQTLKTTGLVK